MKSIILVVYYFLQLEVLGLGKETVHENNKVWKNSDDVSGCRYLRECGECVQNGCSWTSDYLFPCRGADVFDGEVVERCGSTHKLVVQTNLRSKENNVLYDVPNDTRHSMFPDTRLEYVRQLCFVVLFVVVGFGVLVAYRRTRPWLALNSTRCKSCRRDSSRGVINMSSQSYEMLITSDGVRTHSA